MSQPKGKGNGGGSQKKPNQSGNQPQQPTTSFVDADAFGPALGARGRKKNKNQGAAAQEPQPIQAQQQQQQQAAWKTAPTKSAQPAKQQPKPQPQQGAWGQAAGPSQSADSLQPQTAWKTKTVPSSAPAPASAPAPKPEQVAPSKTGTISKARPAPDASKTTKTDEKTRGTIQVGKKEREDKPIKTRPDHVNSKQGTTGMALQNVKANYFAFNTKMQWQVFHYHVTFSPEIENSAFRNALLAQQRPTLGGFLYDRGASIYLIRQLDQQLEFQTRDREGQEYVIRLERVGLISTLESEYIQVLNIIMRKAIQALNLQLVGREYFDAAAAIPIPQYYLQLWPGYSTSIRQHESLLLMNTEIKHKLMRDETLLSIMQRCYNESRQDWKKEFERQVLGSVVLTRYNNKTYRITDVDYDATPRDTFEGKDGPISYIDYYQTIRHVKIRDVTQPLLVSKPTERNIRGGIDRPINLIPELCYATGYTDQMRRNFNLMQETAKYTRVGPSDRVNKLLAFNKRLRSTEGSMQCFQDWALNLAGDLVNVPARTLPQEVIMLGGNKSEKADSKASWMNALQGRATMYVSKVLSEWAVIIPNSMRSNAEQFVKMLMQVSAGMQFKVQQPEIIYINDDRVTTLSSTLEMICQKNKKQMVLVAVSNNSADRYSAIKKTCCVRNSLPSQVVTSRVMDPRNMSKMRSVATKVAIQMNSKIGGMPWLVDVRMNGIMFIGYDVCHDTRNRANSYGAIVATMDMRESPVFYSSVSAHTNGEELSNNLATNVLKAIKQYKEIHKKLPDRILFYRDGVGEGQTNYVHEHELKNLLDKLKLMYQAVPVKLAYVIVSKRINTKFFRPSHREPFENVPAGTVIDDVVTLPERYDFFIVSQHVTQGTATPTNYNVLHDTFGLPPDKLQIMTYKMCHLYYNWSGTTRVPAVCQYAHKLAFLVGNYLHEAPSTGLERSLYFL